MKKYVFSHLEEYIVWQAGDKRCFWCTEPLRFRDSTVDHVLPESLLDHPAELRRLKKVLGLDGKFKINDFSNWVPMHSKCNSLKAAVKMECPMIAYALRRAVAKTPSVRNTHDNLRRLLKLDTVVGRLWVAFEEVSFSDEEEKRFKASVALHGVNVPNLKRRGFDPRWFVTDVFDHVIRVSDGTCDGFTCRTMKNASEWRCPCCQNLGPWSGVICLSCGQKSTDLE